jgi:hypothetical protein
VTITLPRFVIAKSGKAGMAYYWNPPVYWRKQAEAQGRKYPFESQKLGADLRQAELDAAAIPHNARFDEWRLGAVSTPSRLYAAHGTVEWLFEQYQASDIFKRRVAERSRQDYALIFAAISAIPTKDGRRVGQLAVMSMTPAASEKVYSAIIQEEVDADATAAALASSPKAKPVMTGKYRQGEKAIMYAKTAWRLMQPHHPQLFRPDVPNPWIGVQLVKRTKLVKAAVDREAVYSFAWAAIEANRPEAAAAAVICFEWLQRPENVIGGYVRWGDYRPGESIRIEHHKTGQMVVHPLTDGAVAFYPEAEEILAQVPKRGLAIVLGPDHTEPYKPTRFAQIVRKIADGAGLPKTFTLDACRHGGMTELEEAGLTEGQGRALSAHRSRAYERYAKRTSKRLLSATKARHQHRAGGQE